MDKDKDKDKDTLGLIEYEAAILIRRAVSAGNWDKKYGSLDRSAYLLLRQLDEYGPVGVKALAEEFHLDISTVSRQSAALEAKGLAERLSDPADGRVSLFQITELGLQQLTEAKQLRLERFAALLKDWPVEDRQKFGEFLARFNRTFVD